jgi:hypothetical protein
MSRICPECLDPARFDRTVARDAYLRQEPDEEEEGDEDEDNGKENSDDDEDDDGYSE